MSQATRLRFALNHMTAPRLDIARFFALAAGLEISDVEIRNDIAANAILDGTPATAIAAAAAREGLNILTINALQRFNEWNPTRERQAIALADYARDCGAAALVLVPVNDGSGLDDEERLADVEAALRALRPILKSRGITGLVECLGFATSSLRLKSEAVAAIKAIGGEDVFRLVHDSFHHRLAGEAALYPHHTGLVHISGVSDPNVSSDELRDAHRGLVDDRDRLGNIEQIAALTALGYGGPLSFEPFADAVTRLADPHAALADSIAFIETQLRARAA